MRTYFELVTWTPTDIERVRFFDFECTEEAFAETNLRNQPSLRGDDSCVTIEMWWHGSEGASCLRRAWWCISDELRYQWDGSDQVAIYDGAGELDEALVAVDAFPLQGERPECPEEFLEACLAWERSYPDWVDHIMGRQRLMPHSYRVSGYDISGEVQAGVPEGHAVSFHQQAAEAAGILEELAGLLRTQGIFTVAGHRAWALPAMEALQEVAIQADVLRASANVRRQERH